MTNDDIRIKQGATFEAGITIDENGSPVDITGWTFRGQIRPTYSSSTLTVSFTIAITDALNGEALMSLTATQTALIPVNPATGYRKRVTNFAYDVEAVKPDGTVYRIAEGAAEVSPEVTK